MKTLMIFKTHILNKGIISEFKKIIKSGYDCILAINNNNNFFQHINKEELNFTKDINYILYNQKSFEDLELPLYSDISKNNIERVMWYDADYPIYVVKSKYPNYDFYWQIEYDVFCNDNNYKKFFDKYEADTTDLIVSRFAANPPNCGWNTNLDWIYKNKTIYDSYYPVIRLSKNAIVHLQNARKKHKEVFDKLSENSSSRWIHCEIFTSTELLNNGFTGKDLNEKELLRKDNIDLNEDRIWMNPDSKLYHPVKGNYEKKISELKKIIKKYKKNEVPFFKRNFYIGKTQDKTRLFLILFGIKLRFKLKG